MTLLKYDVQIVCLSRGYSYADAVTTGRLLQMSMIHWSKRRHFQMDDLTDTAMVRPYTRSCKMPQIA